MESSGNLRLNTLQPFVFLMLEYKNNSITATLVVFTPPAVDPGLPPKNIKITVKNLLASLKAATSTVLKPAVLGVTEQNRELNILFFNDISCITPFCSSK